MYPVMLWFLLSLGNTYNNRESGTLSLKFDEERADIFCIHTICSRYDEAVILLKKCIELLDDFRSIAKKAVPVEWRPFLVKNLVAFDQRNGEQFEIGVNTHKKNLQTHDNAQKPDEIYQEELKPPELHWVILYAVVVFASKAPGLIFDHTLGRLISGLSGITGRFFLGRGLRVIANRTLGISYGDGRIHRVSETPFLTKDTRVELPNIIEKEVLAHATQYAARGAGGLYMALNQSIQEPEFAENLARIFENNDLVHNSYYRDTKMVKLIAKIIAEDTNSTN